MLSGLDRLSGPPNVLSPDALTVVADSAAPLTGAPLIVPPVIAKPDNAALLEAVKAPDSVPPPNGFPSSLAMTEINDPAAAVVPPITTLSAEPPTIVGLSHSPPMK